MHDGLQPKTGNPAIDSEFSLLAAILLCVLTLLLAACDGTNWNNPYPAADASKNILYSHFSARPKHLDPVQSYSSDEYAFIGQIYEPPLQYHYLKRPYVLEPLTATKIPTPVYLDKQNREVSADTRDTRVAFSVYEVNIKPGIYYQPHPAFAKDKQQHARYLSLTEDDLQDVNTLQDFPHSGTRELVAADYVYQLKRLAHPGLHSPILGLMSEYIVDLKEYAGELKKEYTKQKKTEIKAGRESFYFDLNKYDFAGVEEVDRYTYRIKIKGKYPQLLYWMAMPFFAPMPYEADQFYSQPGMKERNIVLDWYPVGTGAYMLTVNDPNRKMVLERNPNFKHGFYPTEGEVGDVEKGLLADSGKPLPFIDKVIYNLEKESIPVWNKFLQGYYDISGISSDSFDQAIQFSAQGGAELTPLMQEKGIKLITGVETSSFYFGFNMLDEVVGGRSERARLLRQAISIAVDYEEYLSIFANGRGVSAQSIIPPGIFGHIEGEKGINPYVYDWKNGKAVRKPVAEAKRLLKQAGYPNGLDVKTNKPLLLSLDVSGGGPDDKARFDWWRKQFAKIDLQLQIRNTDYNRFREKMRKGNAQLFMWGWNADYPDPENFMFLLYGPNSRVKHQGENAANYSNPEFDRLFEKMKVMQNGPERMKLIQKMIAITRHDAPWLWGFHPKRFVLHHDWYGNASMNIMAHNTLMYKRIDPVLRARSRQGWNKPVVWPLVLGGIILLVSIIPAILMYRHKEHQAAVKQSGTE